MGFQAFVQCITGSSGSFWWRVSFIVTQISHPETSRNILKPNHFQPRVLYEMGFQTVVARMTGSSGSFWWRVSFHSDPDFLSRNISKHPETT